MGLVRLLTLTLALVLAAGPALAGGASESPSADPLAPGAVFPNLSLTGTLTEEQATALGLAGTNTPVALDALKAEVLIVEVFSMYCPFCQQEALTVNALQDLVNRLGLAERIKLIGLGVGNSEAEVSIFQKKYHIPFPLFVDPEFTAHKAIGEVGTPYFYVLRRKAGHKDFTVQSGTLGRMASPEAFLTEVVRKAGLKAPEVKP